MSEYHVLVNCTSFRRIIVEASSKAEAESKACTAFTCPDSGTEVEHGETRIATDDDYTCAELDA